MHEILPAGVEENEVAHARAKRKIRLVAVSDAQISRRIMDSNKTSHASPHELSSVGRCRESFVQVLANI
jgi:hypothetical protein